MCVSTGEPGDSKNCHATATLGEAKFYTVSAMHTKGHSGHPWNEMAGTACDQVSRRDLNFAWPPFPEEIRNLFSGRLGKIELLQSLVQDDERLVAYPHVLRMGTFIHGSGCKMV